MAAVGGCCGRPESAAAEDADVLGSAAPIVALGGCWPVVALAPAVGPAPASFEASNLVTLSISVVHGPAPAVPVDNAARAQAPSSNVIVFMALSPVAIAKRRPCGFRRFHINREREPTFRAAGRERDRWRLSSPRQDRVPRGAIRRRR
jgi:hypothetical protein